MTVSLDIRFDVTTYIQMHAYIYIYICYDPNRCTGNLIKEANAHVFVFNTKFNYDKRKVKLRVHTHTLCRLVAA